jgi:hypothetical protein
MASMPVAHSLKGPASWWCTNIQMVSLWTPNL